MLTEYFLIIIQPLFRAKLAVMRIYILAFLFFSSVPGLCQDTTRKQGFLFMRNASFPPLECVFVELELHRDSSLEYNMLLLNEKKDTGVFVRPILLYKRDRKFNAKINAASHFSNSFISQQKVDSSKDVEENTYNRVLPVQLTFVPTTIFSMNGNDPGTCDTPIVFKGKSILSKSCYTRSEWELLYDLEIIVLGEKRK